MSRVVTSYLYTLLKRNHHLQSVITQEKMLMFLDNQLILNTSQDVWCFSLASKKIDGLDLGGKAQVFFVTANLVVYRPSTSINDEDVQILLVKWCGN